ncbi:MAG: xanthine dehydrogenase family protein subunit M [Actinobacteria bacterium]|nr:xanthine dehydrogenase family protein subunit M [Actinomycetota bacterium]
MSASKLPPFEYYEPATVEQASKLLDNHGDEARVLAGGIDLIPRMRAGTVKVTQVVSLQRVNGLDYMRRSTAGGIDFGAMTTLHALERWEDLRVGFGALYDAIHQITSVQAKCMGTAVGNLCVATPASDVAPALAAYDAGILVAGPKGERRVPLPEFYPAYGCTALGPGEIVTGVEVPAIPKGHGAAFLNLVRTHADIAKVTVTAAVVIADGLCKQARIALGAVAPTMFSAEMAEALLEGEEMTHELIRAAAAAAARETRPIDDLRSTAEYRRATTEVLVARALHKAAGRARVSAANWGADRGPSGEGVTR